MHGAAVTGCAGGARSAATVNTDRWREGPTLTARTPDEDQALKAMRAALERYAPLEKGRVSDHSAMSASADPSLFAIAIATVDGEVWSVGDDEIIFPLQSLSKPFTLALALEDRGDGPVLDQVGMHATGLPFGSLAATEIRSTRLQNPMVSAGAIATTSLVDGEDPVDRWKRTRRLLSAFAGRDLEPITGVFESEMAINEGSLAKAYALASYGLLYTEPMESVSRYLRTCSVGVTVRDLAAMGATLATGGAHPITDERVVSRRHARGVLCAMVTAGMYDDSGPWLYQIGLPAKSGVSGCVLAVVPGRLAIAVYSPPLDEFGNSVRGTAVVEWLASQWDLHVMDRLLP